MTFAEKTESMALRNDRGAICAAGFTLVELVVTLVIIGALAAVSAPLFFNVQDFQRSGFFNETLAGVRYAQKFAVASGCAVQVQFTGNAYTLSQVPSAAFDPNDPTTCNTPPYSVALVDPSNPGNAFTRSAPDGVTVTTATFVFCPLGDTSAGACTGNYANVDLIVNVGGRTFSVAGATGHVR